MKARLQRDVAVVQPVGIQRHHRPARRPAKEVHHARPSAPSPPPTPTSPASPPPQSPHPPRAPPASAPAPPPPHPPPRRSAPPAAAPNSFAVATWSSRFTTAITSTPASAAACINISPIGPAPITIIVSPGPRPALLQPAHHARQRLRQRRMLKRHRRPEPAAYSSPRSAPEPAGYSAYAPLLNSRSSQRFCCPCPQKKHASQGAEFSGTTRSPTANSVTPVAHLRHHPRQLMPKQDRRLQHRAWYPRRYTFRSVPQVSAAPTRTHHLARPRQSAPPPAPAAGLPCRTAPPRPSSFRSSLLSSHLPAPLSRNSLAPSCCTPLLHLIT